MPRDKQGENLLTQIVALHILDAVAWKEGYNGLTCGTAAFTLLALAEKMNVSRQHLSCLLAELEASDLQLTREKLHGKYAPWLFRFAAFDQADDDGDNQDVTSGEGDRSPYIETQNKTVFSGQINIDADANVFRTCWADGIKAAKTALPCWNVDIQHIWERFLAFNRARGNALVPAGYLLGFMRKWRTSPGQPPHATQAPAPAPQKPIHPEQRKLLEQIKAAPSDNRQFHAYDLCRRIGQAAYDVRILDVIRQFGCPRFTAALAVHGRAVSAGEIAR